jgi:hypothetical protein
VFIYEDNDFTHQNKYYILLMTTMQENNPSGGDSSDQGEAGEEEGQKDHAQEDHVMLL